LLCRLLLCGLLCLCRLLLLRCLLCLCGLLLLCSLKRNGQRGKGHGVSVKRCVRRGRCCVRSGQVTDSQACRSRARRVCGRCRAVKSDSNNGKCCDNEYVKAVLAQFLRLLKVAEARRASRDGMRMRAPSWKHSSRKLVPGRAGGPGRTSRSIRGADGVTLL
jgi:hypothetical protein